MKKKFIIDTDTASDDAVALIMAINSPNIKVEAITVVAGNVELEKGIQNALHTVALCEVDTPLFAGIEKPLIRPLHTACHVHGNDGLGDVGIVKKNLQPQKKHAVNAIVELINEQPNEIILVCLGPLTNIAVALTIDPDLANKVKECVIMGGTGQGSGNITPLSEYNFWADPEAAKIVFESGMPIKMVGWDVSKKYSFLNNENCEAIKEINTTLSNFSLAIQKRKREFVREIYNKETFELPDPIAMAVAIDNSVATEIKKAHISILTNNDDSRGQSVVDYLLTNEKNSNVSVVLKADREKFLDMLYKSIS